MCIVNKLIIRSGYHLHKPLFGEKRQYNISINYKCGFCTECLQARSCEWAFRLYCESKRRPYVYKIVLTYNDYQENKHKICLRDYQLFMKKLKLKFTGLKQWTKAEYGDIGKRAHFHILLFSVKDITFELRLILRTVDDFYENIYSSCLLESMWQKGFVRVKVVDSLNADSFIKEARYQVLYVLSENMERDKKELRALMAIKKSLILKEYKTNIPQCYDVINRLIYMKKQSMERLFFSKGIGYRAFFESDLYEVYKKTNSLVFSSCELKMPYSWLIRRIKETDKRDLYLLQEYSNIISRTKTDLTEDDFIRKRMRSDMIRQNMKVKPEV